MVCCDYLSHWRGFPTTNNRFLGDSAASDALLSLRRNIDQVALPQELKASLSAQVTNRTVAQTLLEELEQALVIMVDSIVEAEVSGDTKLWSVLMLQSDSFGDVRLKHVNALYVLGRDDWDGVGRIWLWL